MLGLLSPGSAKADVEWSENQNTHLIASCVRNFFRQIILKSGDIS